MAIEAVRSPIKNLQDMNHDMSSKINLRSNGGNITVKSDLAPGEHFLRLQLSWDIPFKYCKYEHTSAYKDSTNKVVSNIINKHTSYLSNRHNPLGVKFSDWNAKKLLYISKRANEIIVANLKYQHLVIR